MIGEYQNGVIVREYFHLDAIPLIQFESTKTLYLHPDHLGTPRSATDSTKDVVWTWSGDAFGRDVAITDPDGNTVDENVPLRFPGQYYDAELGLHYNYFRTYDPSIGRYTQSDPIGLAGGLNTYGYVHGNPLRYSDPKGLAAQVCLIPGVNVACGAAATAVAEAVGGLALLGGVLSIPGDSAEPQSCPKPAIADVEPGDLCEQLALAEAKAGAGVVIMTALADEPRLISHYGAGPWVNRLQRVRYSAPPHSWPDRHRWKTPGR